MKKLRVAILAILVSACTAHAYVITNIFDDFNRADSDNLGTTPIGGYTWIENEFTNNTIRIIGNQVQANHNPSLPRNSATLDYSTTNVVMEADFNLVNLGYYNVGFMYRVASTNTCFINCSGDGYRVALNQVDGQITLQWGGAGTVLKAYNMPGGFVTGSNYHITAVAEGSAHSIFLNGQLVIAYNDPVLSRVKTGVVGLGSYNTSSGWRLDNFLVATIPEPGTGLLVAGALATGLVLCRRCRS